MITAESSIQDLANAYNALFETAVEAKTLGKRGKGKVFAQIEQKAAEVGFVMTDESVKQLAEFGSLAKWAEWEANRKAEEEAAAAKANTAPLKEEKAKKEKGPTIRSVAEELLLVVKTYDSDGRPYGMSYDDILKAIEERFNGAKTTVACLRWYAVHMRERGERVPHRPRATPAKKQLSEETA